MAYNLESLVKIIEQIMHPDYHRHPWTIDPYKKLEIESLLMKVKALKQLFGNSSSPLSRNKMESLESRIRDTTYEAEDILESHLVDQIRPVFTLSLPSLQKVIGELDSAEEEIKKMIDENHIPESSSSLPALSRIDPNPKKILVGLSQDAIDLKERLMGLEAKLEIIPIAGMGGIGKTTLARYVYDDALVAYHFYTRAWITISQDYEVRAILVGLLECLSGKLTDEMVQKENCELGLRLHQSLCGRRYLIVLDDMWDNKAWDDIRWFFPDDKMGSRVLVTTRESSVAKYVGSNSSHHQMHLLNKDDSWDLLRQKLFAQETCPTELEKVGEKIANNCGGLPLTIHVIGGLLSQETRTEESWAQVAKVVTSVVANNDEQFLKIFSLSYNHLPNHLRPCFLYMSAFPEDHEIRSSYLIRLWVAEGFLEPVSDKSLEETADMHLKALVDRNLIFVRQQEISGIFKSYGIHDLLRELCLRKACEEKFLYLTDGQLHSFPRNRLSLRRVSVHSFHSSGDTIDRPSYGIREIYDYDSMESMALARSILYIGSASRVILSLGVFGLVFLRVLDLLGIELYRFPKEMLKLVNLRYIAFACRTSLSSSLSALWNLQTIIFRQTRSSGTSEAPHEIFDMPCLRHIKFQKAYPHFAPPDGKSFIRQEYLQTLSCVTVYPGFDRIIESTPNLKKLGIFCFYDVDSDIDLTCLHKLEALKCSSALSPEALSFLSCLIFPPSLKKLTLHKCAIPIGYMNKIESLPNLAVLKLRDCVLESSTWDHPTDGEFSSLQFLLLEELSLVKWEADETYFPKLERLVIRHCCELEEIPSGIGEISTLEIIEVHESSPSVVASALKIQEEQQTWGNYGLQILITGSSR